MSKEFIALLPIKKNSERVPGKNFKTFYNKPLFQWILDTLLSVDAIPKIIINTDAHEQLKVHGLQAHPKIVIRERREDICGDFVSMNKIIEDDLDNTEGINYIMTHVTNPLISKDTIQQALNVFNAKQKEGYDSLFSVNQYQSRFYSINGKPLNHNPSLLQRTQDLEPLLEENSCLYIFTKESFKTTNARIGKTPYMFPTPPSESIDIDDAETWKIAEGLKKSNATSSLL